MLPNFITAVRVISLPQSLDRRERIAPHLKEKLNLASFEYHDAYDPDHQEVKKLFENNMVASYPPCFRCGNLSCDKPNCNNVLLPQQVANFASFLNLWTQISATDDITLVLEDDVVIHDWAARVLDKLAADVARSAIDIAAEKPRLIRLGWALGKQHNADQRYRFNDQVRMANPAHILTPAYARALLSRFETVNHTSDTFMHKIAPKPGEAITVFPPIASDLSWNTGAMESTIHPKPIRSKWLHKNGETNQANINDHKVKQHIQHMFHRPLLITGHPRCGTGFAAALCQQIGLDVGHEGDGTHGVSSWMMATDADENPWFRAPVAKTRRALHWDVLIHMVRDLDTALPSVMRENEHAPISLAFRREHIHTKYNVDICATENLVERAALSIIYWNRMVREMEPDIVLKIGGDIPAFVSDLSHRNLPVAAPQTLDLAPVNQNKAYQGKKHPLPEIKREAWSLISNSTMDLLAQEAEIIGCTLPFSSNKSRLLFRKLGAFLKQRTQSTNPTNR